MGGGDQPSHTTSTTEVKLPEWVDKASQENYEFAKKVANRPLQQYKGDLVADIPGITKESWDLFERTLGTGQGEARGAADAYGGLAGGTITADKVNAGQLANTNLDPYLNPWISNVENAAMGNLERQRELGLMGASDAATRAGAFGGDRAAIERGVIGSESARAAGELSAGLRKSGFDTAMGLAGSDINRTMQGDLANQAAGLRAQESTAASRAAGAQGLLSSGEALQKLRLQDIAGMGAIGQQQQQQEQKEIGADVAKFEEKRNYPIEQLNILLSSLGMSPYGKTETTETTGTSEKPGFDPFTGGMGMLSLLAGMFSDRRDKRDIQKLGTDPDTGLNVYAYRYKRDRSGPKTVGVIAQDVERKYPGSTAEIGGHLVIKPGAVRGLLSDGG